MRTSTHPGGDERPSFDRSDREALAPISIVRAGAVWRIKVTGDFDLGASRALAEQTTNLDRAGRPEAVEFDASDVRFVDPSAVASIHAFHVACTGLSIDFRIVSPSPQFVRVLELTGLCGLLDH